MYIYVLFLTYLVESNYGSKSCWNVLLCLSFFMNLHLCSVSFFLNIRTHKNYDKNYLGLISQLCLELLSHFDKYFLKTVWLLNDLYLKIQVHNLNNSSQINYLLYRLSKKIKLTVFNPKTVSFNILKSMKKNWHVALFLMSSKRMFYFCRIRWQCTAY